MKLEAVELIMAVEDAFMIEIADSKAELVTSLGELGTIVEAELHRLHRPRETAVVMNQIVHIAALFSGLARAGLGPQTALADIVTGNEDGWNRAIKSVPGQAAGEI